MTAVISWWPKLVYHHINNHEKQEGRWKQKNKCYAVMSLELIDHEPINHRLSLICNSQVRRSNTAESLWHLPACPMWKTMVLGAKLKLEMLAPILIHWKGKETKLELNSLVNKSFYFKLQHLSILFKIFSESSAFSTEALVYYSKRRQ